MPKDKKAPPIKTAAEEGQEYRTLLQEKGQFYVEMVSLFAVMAPKAVRPLVEKPLMVFEEIHHSVRHIQDREQQRDALRALAFSDESPSTAENLDVDRSTAGRLETRIDTDRWKDDHVNWMLQMAIGVAYQATGDGSDLNRAIGYYRRASQQFSEHYEPHILLARALRQHRQSEASEEEFQKAADLLWISEHLEVVLIGKAIKSGYELTAQAIAWVGVQEFIRVQRRIRTRKISVLGGGSSAKGSEKKIELKKKFDKCTVQLEIDRAVEAPRYQVTIEVKGNNGSRFGELEFEGLKVSPTAGSDGTYNATDVGPGIYDVKIKQNEHQIAAFRLNIQEEA